MPLLLMKQYRLSRLFNAKSNRCFVTPDEAVRSHELFAAALRSHVEERAIGVS